MKYLDWFWLATIFGCYLNMLVSVAKMVEMFYTLLNIAGLNNRTCIEKVTSFLHQKQALNWYTHLELGNWP